jgi:hypothetical protein
VCCLQRLEHIMLNVLKESGKVMWKLLKRIYRDLFGADCSNCGEKYSVFFYDATIVDKKRAEIYKCISCKVEEWHWEGFD